MHLFWETTERPGAKIDQRLNWLSWIGSGTGGNPSEGYLGAGSQHGVVGITKTDLEPRRNSTQNRRTNYNLRGHHSAVTIVEWNQQHNKLASCDENGIIHVWVRYEDRWTVELVNDRGVKIKDFQWSPNGSQVLICYSDSFILVGSVNGQRNWSTQLNDSTVLCGTWHPDSVRVILGTAVGSLLIVNHEGTVLETHQLRPDHPIEKLTWSTARNSDGKACLVVCFKDGTVYFLDDYDGLDPVVVHTNSEIVRVQWCENGELMAVVGTQAEGTSYRNWLKIFQGKGTLLYTCAIPSSPEKKVSAMSWGYNDCRLFVAAQNEILVAQVHSQVPHLQMLASYTVWRCLQDKEANIAELPLPPTEQRMIETHNYQTIQCCVPSPEQLLKDTCRPCQWRWHCTIIPEVKLTTHLSASWALCLEHLGGLIPILRGRQVNKFRPEFELRAYTNPDATDETNRSNRLSSFTASSEPPISDFCGDSCESAEAKSHSGFGVEGSRSARRTFTPNTSAVGPTRRVILSDSDQSTPTNFPRDSVWRRSKRSIQALVHKAQLLSSSPTPQPVRKLVQVTSNVWCTRFKLIGLDNGLLPPYIGQVIYKTSVLHLQPRQMTVHLVDLDRPNIVTVAPPPPPLLSDFNGDSEFPAAELCSSDQSLLPFMLDEGPPIAPFPSEIFSGYQTAVGIKNSSGGGEIRQPLPSTSSMPSTSAAVVDVENEFPYVDLSANPSHFKGMNEGLGTEEVVLFRVLREFQELKSAVDRHILRMREFAVDLQQSGHQLNESDSDVMNGLVGRLSHYSTPPVSRVNLESTQTSATISVTSDGPATVQIQTGQTISVAPKPIVGGPPISQVDQMISVVEAAANNENDLESQQQQRAEIEPPPVVINTSSQGKRQKSFLSRIFSGMRRRNWSNPSSPKSLDPSRSAESRRSRVLRSFRFRHSSKSPSVDVRCDLLRPDNDSHVGRSIVSTNPTITRSDSALCTAGNGDIRSPMWPTMDELMYIDEDENVFISDSESRFLRTKATSFDRAYLCPYTNGNRHSTADVNRQQHTGVEVAVQLEDSTDSPLPAALSKSTVVSTSPAFNKLVTGGKTESPKNVKTSTRQLKEIVSVLDKLYKLAGELTTKPPVHLATNFAGPYVSVSSKICPSRAGPPAGPLAPGDGAPEVSAYAELYARIRDISSRVSQLESRILHGNELLEEVRRDLQNRVHCIREVLKEEEEESPVMMVKTASKAEMSQSRSSESTLNATLTEVKPSESPDVLQLQNKAPFWNEASQIYQLDFGGRVTQESAKNFQIEFKNEQVMQFGRIEGNSFTLDFQSPFSAVQAFAVALASITQRLK